MRLPIAVFRLLFAVLLCCGCLAGARAATLDPSVLPKVQAATFEVVAAKPTGDAVTYEKPLPLDLLPYQERTDKYYSIGTAFAIGDNRFVTAAHVLDVGLGSLWGPLALRDGSGHVYAIDKIQKYSMQQDFVVFSLVDPPKLMPLVTNTRPTLDDVVYAVGNALGTGVVIRDGLYTSDTPEDQDGRWKWMRFSAAASPGNSGGPLLDKNGKVIGVVLMKSANENLNYALPIAKVLDAPEGVADFDKRLPYQLDIFDTPAQGTLKAQFKLPLPLVDFDARVLALLSHYADSQVAALLARDPAKLFPRGSGSSRLLYEVPRLESAPALIVRNTQGQWVRSGRTGGSIPLTNNGYVLPGMSGHEFMLYLRSPDTVPPATLRHDPKRYMDLLLRTGFLSRNIGGEKIKVTSLGQPSESSIYTDAWKRRWQVDVWPVPYANMRIITFSLPVPEGYATMMRFSPSMQEHDDLADLKVLAGFVDVSYVGQLKAWPAFLADTALLPDALRAIHLDVQPGKRFVYTSPRFKLDVPSSAQTVAPDNLLWLGFSYFTDDRAADRGQVVWDVSYVQLRPDQDSDARWYVRRHAKPPADLDDDFQIEWRRLMQRQHPFEDVAYNVDGNTQIATTANGGTPDVIYSLGFTVEGTQPTDAMKQKLGMLKAGFVPTGH